MTNPLTSEKFERAGANLNTWIGIGGACFGLITTCVLLGMYFGTIKDLPSQLEAVRNETKSELKEIAKDNAGNFTALTAQIATMNTKADKQDWELTSLKGDVGSLSGRLEANLQDDERQWEKIRKTETQVAASVSREAFIQWKSDLERRNASISAPALQSQ